MATAEWTNSWLILCHRVCECVCHPQHQTHRISNSVLLFLFLLLLLLLLGMVCVISFGCAFDFDSIMPGQLCSTSFDWLKCQYGFMSILAIVVNLNQYHTHFQKETVSFFPYIRNIISMFLFFFILPNNFRTHQIWYNLFFLHSVNFHKGHKSATWKTFRFSTTRMGWNRDSNIISKSNSRLFWNTNRGCKFSFVSIHFERYCQHIWIFKCIRNSWSQTILCVTAFGPIFSSFILILQRILLSFCIPFRSGIKFTNTSHSITPSYLHMDFFCRSLSVCAPFLTEDYG